MIKPPVKIILLPVGRSVQNMRRGVSRKLSCKRFYNMGSLRNRRRTEEEREMVPFCRDQRIALTPYSPLASGRLSRKPGETTKRYEMDTYARFKYDKSPEETAYLEEPYTPHELAGVMAQNGKQKAGKTAANRVARLCVSSPGFRNARRFSPVIFPVVICRKKTYNNYVCAIPWNEQTW